MYIDEETGFEKWKADFNTFLSDDFQNKLNSTNKSFQEKYMERYIGFSIFILWKMWNSVLKSKRGSLEPFERGKRICSYCE